jgi:hypothetical protein
MKEQDYLQELKEAGNLPAGKMMAAALLPAAAIVAALVAANKLFDMNEVKKKVEAGCGKFKGTPAYKQCVSKTKTAIKAARKRAKKG